MPREKIVKRRLADGTVKEYRYSGGSAKPTVGRVIREYKESSEFRTKLTDSSRKNYNVYLDIIGTSYHDVPIEDIRRSNLKRHRDAYQDRPGTSNKILATWSILLKHAVESEYIPYNPAWKIPRLDLGERKRWPDDAIDIAAKRFPERVKRAVFLALYTGQRVSDIIKMMWNDIGPDGIHVIQKKTKTELWIPVHANLRPLLAEWKGSATTLTILSNAYGRPWASSHALTEAFQRSREKVPELTGFTLHGLRKAAAARLAEAGCSTHEIAAITGHTTLKEIERYTREANQKTRAAAAIHKLEIKNGK